MNIQWSSRSDNWYTPVEIIELVKQVLGKIDLDPASSNDANESIQATRIIGLPGNGLTDPWKLPSDDEFLSVFLNPPGSKIKNKSKTGLFWNRLMQEVAQGNIKHAIFLAFSVEALQMTQNYAHLSILDFPFCVPSKRIHFIDPQDSSKQAPSHSNVIVYIPGSEDKTELFQRIFNSIGKVKV